MEQVNPQLSGKYRGQTIYHFVTHELIMAAQYHGLVTYQVIAKMMGLPSSGNYMAHELGIILGEISEDEVRKGRPMLSAMAVGVSGEPGEGFYTLAKELGLLQDDSPEEKRQFWEEQKARVYETWRAE